MSRAWNPDRLPAAVRHRWLAVLAAASVAAACGQKGPPLPPLQRVPEAATELTVRRVEDRALLRMLLPVRNVEGPGPVALDRLQVFAMTVPAGASAPSDADLFADANLAGEFSVRPEPVEGAAPVQGDPRPAPGEAATFEEELTPAVLAPAAIPEPAAGRGAPGSPTPKPADASAQPPGAVTPGAPVPVAVVSQPGEATEPAAAEAERATAADTQGSDAGKKAPDPPAAQPAGHPLRVYAVRGLTRGGRRGRPSARVELPLVSVPPAPSGLSADVIEAGVRLEWVPPEDADLSFNIYVVRDDPPVQPVNPSPVPDPAFEHAGVTLGEEHCYRVRSIVLAGKVPIEGAASEVVCVTPRDVFPPAPPTGLTAVPTEGQISLIWDANAEPDLAGYLVLRGEAPDGPLKALMTEPIKETSFRDASVTPGVRYLYAVVAIDNATPPNPSAQSERIEETAR